MSIQTPGDSKSPVLMDNDIRPSTCNPMLSVGQSEHFRSLKEKPFTETAGGQKNATGNHQTFEIQEHQQELTQGDSEGNDELDEFAKHLEEE